MTTITTATIKELRDATGAGLLDCRKALLLHDGNIEKAAAYLREKGLGKADQKASREMRSGLVIVKSAGDAFCGVEVACETDFVARTAEFKAFAHGVADLVLADASLTDADNVLTSAYPGASVQTVGDVLREMIARLGENMAVRQAARYVGSPAIEGYIHTGDVDSEYAPGEGRIGVLVEVGAEGPADPAALRALAHDLALQIAALGARYVAPGDIPADALQAERDTLMAQLADEKKPDAIKAKIVAGRLEKFYEDKCLLRQTYIRDDSITVEELLRRKSAEIGAPVTVRRFARLEVGA